MKTDMKHECFRTKDLNEAAFLYSSGGMLLDIEREEGRCWFVFKNREGCRRLSAGFWNRQASVNAKDFADAIRTLKDLIYNNAERL